MTQIDFYLLNETNKSECDVYICRLINKIYQRKHKVYIHCSSEKEAHYFDELLWTYQDDSFIPHHLRNEGPEPPPPVEFGYEQTAPVFYDVLLNISASIPEFYRQFQRVLEVVSADPTQREISREHYRFYRDAGFKPTIHEVAVMTSV